MPIKGAAAEADNVTITGDMTIKGVTQKISFPAKVDVQNGVASKMTIGRTTLGLKYGLKKLFSDKAIDDNLCLTFSVVDKNK